MKRSGGTGIKGEGACSAAAKICFSTAPSGFRLAISMAAAAMNSYLFCAVGSLARRPWGRPAPSSSSRLRVIDVFAFVGEESVGLCERLQHAIGVLEAVCRAFFVECGPVLGPEVLLVLGGSPFLAPVNVRAVARVEEALLRLVVEPDVFLELASRLGALLLCLRIVVTGFADVLVDAIGRGLYGSPKLRPTTSQSPCSIVPAGGTFSSWR